MIGKTRLHPLTWLIVAAGAAHLAGDLIYAVQDIQSYRDTGFAVGGREGHFSLILASVDRSVSYSLLFFGTAATIEFLVRIWRELQLMRIGGAAPTGRPGGGAEPPTSA